ncbi:FAD synthase [Brachionus plicatilis]|uniref:FAD synthase n=1 Tax=Brachionus plicatilis TaxID=10195 RepID=A0A3M7T548_BRAPC|nr:FAD synthase [Brachionus plicatilis]
MSSLRSQVINLYKNLLYYGKDYPLGNDYFKNRLRKAFNSNRNVTDPTQIEALIKRGEFVIKEIDALYKLKKYRHLKKSYYDQEPAKDLVLVTTSSASLDFVLDQLRQSKITADFLKNADFYSHTASLFTRLCQTSPRLNAFVNADHLVYNFDSAHLANLDDEVLNFLSKKINLSTLCAKIKHSLAVIEKCFRKKPSNRQTCISFNGGKDCCVVLYLYYACALRMGYEFPLNVLIINIKHSFAEMDNFIDLEITNFFKNSLNFIIFDDTSKSLKECLFELKSSNDDLDTILMGTRRTDSSYFKTMPEFSPTDKDWPDYMRVSPILDWNYSEIWYFIRALRLPYCSLYDRGYTSLDSKMNTVPNKALLKPDGTYLPAYFLENEELERESRIKHAKL